MSMVGQYELTYYLLLLGHRLDSAKTKRILREAHERLEAQRHPDPYIQAYMPGGTLFMRNPAIPLEVMYPDGIPEGYSK